MPFRRIRTLFSRTLKQRRRTAYLVVFTIVVIFGVGVYLAEVFFYQDPSKPAPEPFPVGVDPSNKRIVEDPSVNSYLTEHLAHDIDRPSRLTWLGRIRQELTRNPWLQNLAAPLTRVVVIWPGDRREQAANNFGKILGWNEAQEDELIELVTETKPEFDEGTFFPQHYTVQKDATPEQVAKKITTQFQNEIHARYNDDVAARVPLIEALTIASLLEREAYDFTDMREISGVIWNRLFIGMKLQLDATLQYAKGSRPTGPWWPRPVPDDKYIESPYNTYQNEGLPPGPIANPSLDAVLAALNPKQTDCLFYFHDPHNNFHCSKTYEGHVSKLREIFGQGR